MRRLACLVILVTACGDNSHNLVQLEIADGTVRFVMVHDDVTDRWEHPALVGGIYEFEVVDDYELIAVVDDPFFERTDTHELASTFADDDHWVLFPGDRTLHAVDAVQGVAYWGESCLPAFNDARLLPITGHMAQPGRVWTGSACDDSGTAPWQVTLQMMPGTHEVVAADLLDAKQPRVVVTDVSVAGASSTLPDVDLARDGTALVPRPVVVTNVDDPFDVSVTTSLFGPEVGGAIARTRSVVSAMHTVSPLVIPDAAMRPGHSQSLALDAIDRNALVDRYAVAPLGDPQPVFDLLPPPAVTFDTSSGGLVTRWDTLVDRIGVLDTYLTTSTVTQQLRMTRRWIDDHHATSAAFDTGAPGFQPGWRPDLSTEYAHKAVVLDLAGPIRYSTTITGNLR